jgi:putative membrane protein
MLVARRSALRLALAAIPAAFVSTLFVPAAHAVEALPDARFVGWAEAVNEFQIASGKLALSKSGNEIVRGYATRMIAEHTEAASFLVKSRSEAGVSYAPDPAAPPNTAAILQRLSGLQGPEFDTSYANAQLGIQTDAEAQYGAYSQNGKSGPLRRYAQMMLPKSQEQLEYAKRLVGGR